MRRESMGGGKTGRNNKEEGLSQEVEGRTQETDKEAEGRKGGGQEQGLLNERREGKISMKEQKLIRAARRERWRVKKALREKNKKERERKKQAIKEEMIRKGRETTRKQYTLRLWAIGGGPLGKEGKGNEEEKDGDKENRRNTRHQKQPREGEGEDKKGIG